MRKISGHICEGFYISLIDVGRYIPNSNGTISRRKWAEHNSIHHRHLTRMPCSQPAFCSYHQGFPIYHHIFPMMVQWASWTVRQNKTFSPKLLLVRYLAKAITTTTTKKEIILSGDVSGSTPPHNGVIAPLFTVLKHPSFDVNTVVLRIKSLTAVTFSVRSPSLVLWVLCSMSR